MRVSLAVLGAMLLSTTAFAGADCSKAALAIAKLNLDSKARAFGTSESDIIDETIKQIHPKKKGSLAYSLEGDIYKAQYDITVQVESDDCSVESVRIVEVGL